MEPLQAALQPIVSRLNRNIRETTPALELCRELDGLVVAVRVRNTALSACFEVAGDAISVSGDYNDEPDIVISGSLLTLARMAGNAGEDAIRDGSLELTGDAQKAQRFQRLLAMAKPDVEEELSGVIGDAAAHRLGSIARGVGRWARDARSTMGANVREYLQEESGDVPSRYEVDKFAARVNVLRDDVDRVEARINRLQERS
jgi:ubiquinone biosynthesis protein UbiJ